MSETFFGEKSYHNLFHIDDWNVFLRFHNLLSNQHIIYYSVCLSFIALQIQKYFTHEGFVILYLSSLFFFVKQLNTCSVNYSQFDHLRLICALLLMEVVILVLFFISNQRIFELNVRYSYKLLDFEYFLDIR